MLPIAGITKTVRTDEATEILKQCTISGNTVTLPVGQLDRKLYQEVSKRLNLIGGDWNRKVKGFIFKEDPTKLMQDICNGQKRNIQKEFQFFETPPELADWLVELAEPILTDCIGEPEAGQGAILRAIWKKLPGKVIFGCELMELNRKVLAKMAHFCLLMPDFLKLTPKDLITANGQLFDKVIANPPFQNNSDISHIIQMYLLTKEGGRIVTVASKHWQFSVEKKCQQFREWLNEIGAEVKDVPAGTFKASGTMIETVCIVINK